MKKKILGFITGLFLIVGLTNSGVAASGNWVDWYVDWDGVAGGDTAQTSGHFDVDSPNAVVFDTATSGDFHNYGLVTIVSDGDYSLTGKYELTGTQTGSDLSFDAGGTLTLSINTTTGTTDIATLALVDGQGFYNDVFQFGAVKLTYELTSLLTPATERYLFWEGGSSWAVNETFFTSTTNMIPNNNQDEIDKLKATFPEVDANADKALFLASGGQVGAVPVPSAFLLLGSGIIGLIGFRRKNS